MKKIILFLLLFAAVKAGVRAQTITIVNNTPFNVGLYINYSTVPATCATNKTAVYSIAGNSNNTYNVGTLTWSGATPPAGGFFTAVTFSDDVWLGVPHNINPNPCGNSPRYDDGVVGDPGTCPGLTTYDCIITDGSNAWIFPPPYTQLTAIFTPGVNAVVTFN